MAKAIITLEDLDLDAGTFKHSLVIEESRIDDGQMTAAHVSAKFMTLQLSHPQFIEQIWAYAESLVANTTSASIPNSPGFVAANDRADLAA